MNDKIEKLKNVPTWEDALTWFWVEACVSLDVGDDIRKKEFPELLNKFLNDMKKSEERFTEVENER